MKFKYKTKKLFKNISLGLLGLGAIGAIGVGATKIVEYAKNDFETIHPIFEVGGLGEDGKYVKDELSLYTKDAFACDGLSAKLDFDSEISYQFFFYDINDNFISSSEVYREGANATIPLNGAYARVEITPLNDEDGKISLKERVTYPSQLNLKVDKKAESNINKKFTSYKGHLLEVVDSTVDMVFVNHLSLDYTSGDIDWVDSNFWASTSVTLLNVDGYNKVNFNKGNNFGELNVQFIVYEFGGELNNLSCKLYSGQTQMGLWNLNKDTKYILISVSTLNNDVSFTDSQVAKLPSLFTLEK